MPLTAYLLFIEVTAEEGLIRQRMKHPREDSDANFETYLEMKEEWEPLQEEHLVLRSADGNIDSMLDEAMKYLQQDHDDSPTDR